MCANMFACQCHKNKQFDLQLHVSLEFEPKKVSLMLLGSALRRCWGHLGAAQFRVLVRGLRARPGPVQLHAECVGSLAQQNSGHVEIKLHVMV